MYIDTKDLPAQLKPLAGTFKTIQVEGVPSVTKHADDGTWSGGTRRILSAVELETGRAVSIVDTFSAPWSPERQSREIELKRGFAILSTGHFCGKPSAPHLYLHPQDLAPLLPPPEPDLTPDEQVWLHCVCTLISAYRREEAHSRGLSDARILVAREGLTRRGMLTAIGSATTKGRNACPKSLPSRWAATAAPEPVTESLPSPETP